MPDEGAGDKDYVCVACSLSECLLCVTERETLRDG